MEELSIAEVGRRLTLAGRLKTKPLCVYGADRTLPEWMQLAKIDRCLVKAFLKLSVKELPPAYVGEGALKGCCLGGAFHLGYAKMPEGLKYFVSSGSPTFRGGAAEYLKMTPEMVQEVNKVAGKITPLARLTVVRPCADFGEEDPGVVSVMCLGTAEQIRNICALGHFSTTNVFGAIVVPGGSACSTLVTYPAGMAANAPKDTMFVGPVDPTGNRFFPADFMAAAMPLATAKRICGPIEESFVFKRPKVAYPDEHEVLD
jgi:hypothetical protein